MRTLTAIAIASLSIGTAYAACVPFGSDDSGCLPPNKTAAACENKVEGSVATKLALGIVKCHLKQVATDFKGATFDEETCESTAMQKFVSAAPNANCSCVNPTGIATAGAAVLDSGNHLIFCDPAGTPIGGDDTGNVPSSKGILGCEAKLAKCLTLLVKGYTKCHQLAAKSAVGGKTFDEEGCETTNPKGPVIAFNNCVASLTGCQGCEQTNVPTIRSMVDATIDGANNLVYCESPSGAFLN